MLVAIGDGPTGPLAIFGIDAENVRRLKAGSPIHKELAQFGGPNLTIIIAYAETLDELTEELGKYVKLPPTQTYWDT